MGLSELSSSARLWGARLDRRHVMCEPFHLSGRGRLPSSGRRQLQTEHAMLDELGARRRSRVVEIIGAPLVRCIANANGGPHVCWAECSLRLSEMPRAGEEASDQATLRPTRAWSSATPVKANAGEGICEQNETRLRCNHRPRKGGQARESLRNSGINDELCLLSYCPDICLTIGASQSYGTVR